MIKLLYNKTLGKLIARIPGRDDFEPQNAKGMQGRTPGAGYIGEVIEGQYHDTPGTSPITLITVTLTPGTWLVNGNTFLNLQGIADQSYRQEWLIHGASGGVYAKDAIYHNQEINSRESCPLPTRVITIEESDSNKTVSLKLDLDRDCFTDAYVIAVRIA